MNTVKAGTGQLQGLVGPTTDVAYDASARRMATCSASSSGSIVQVHEYGPAPDSWTPVAAWETDPRVTHLAWAHPEYGRVLAGATSSGTVLLWAQLPEVAALSPTGPGTEGGAGPEEGAGGPYGPLAELSCGSSPCCALCFAPRQSGLLLAVLTDDGEVVIYEAEEALAPKVWKLHSKIKVSTREECRGLCWRPFTPGVAPMLCVGAGQEALVWQFVLALATWQLVARLETGNGDDVVAVHWAPPLGRPTELLAVAAGRDLLLFGLSGETSTLAVERLASLEHEDAVWKVEWDLWGNQVAAATEGQQVHVYKPNLVGTWIKLAWVQGQAAE